MGLLQTALTDFCTTNNLTVHEAAKHLGLSTRHAERIKSGWEPKNPRVNLSLLQTIQGTIAQPTNTIPNSPIYGAEADDLPPRITALVIERAKLVTLHDRIHARITTIDHSLLTYRREHLCQPQSQTSPR